MTLKLEFITSVFLLFFFLSSRKGKWERETYKYIKKSVKPLATQMGVKQ
jgi:hypothetical protein